MDSHEPEQFAAELRRLRDRPGALSVRLPGGCTSTEAMWAYRAWATLAVPFSGRGAGSRARRPGRAAGLLDCGGLRGCSGCGGDRIGRRDAHTAPRRMDRDVGGIGGCGSSALSDSCSKSACAFPMMSNAVRVFFNSPRVPRSTRGAVPTRWPPPTASAASPTAGNQPPLPMPLHHGHGSTQSHATNTDPPGAGSRPSPHSAHSHTPRQSPACTPG